MFGFESVIEHAASSHAPYSLCHKATLVGSGNFDYIYK